MPRKKNPEALDDDNPELDASWFAKAVPAEQVLAATLGADVTADLLKPKRGRPVLEAPKQHVNIRLDADIVSAFKRPGRGWQTRLNSALREWLTTHGAKDA